MQFWPEHSYIKVFNGSLMPKRWSPNSLVWYSRLSMTWLSTMSLVSSLATLLENLLLYNTELLPVLYIPCCFILGVHAFPFPGISSPSCSQLILWLMSGIILPRQSYPVCQVGLSILGSHSTLCLPLSYICYILSKLPVVSAHLLH